MSIQQSRRDEIIIELELYESKPRRGVMGLKHRLNPRWKYPRYHTNLFLVPQQCKLIDSRDHGQKLSVAREVDGFNKGAGTEVTTWVVMPRRQAGQNPQISYLLFWQWVHSYCSDPAIWIVVKVFYLNPLE